MIWPTFDDPRMTITAIAPRIYQGASPSRGESFAAFGDHVHAYILRAELSPDVVAEYRDACLVHVPLHDNANAPLEDPPRIIGADLYVLESLARGIAHRQREGGVSVVCCQWGYNRSGLLVGLALAELGLGFAELLDMMRRMRGPHPLGFGEALNNPNFREIVRRAARP